jgi:hypothetical protein
MAGEMAFRVSLDGSIFEPPMSALCQKQTSTNSFNHLVGGHLRDQWNSKTERLGGLEVDHELEFGGP